MLISTSRLKLMLAGLLCGFGITCAALAETVPAQDHTVHHAPVGLDWPGVYHGFLPCADCKGIRTTLALNKNNSYILLSQYVGKSEREFVEKGKFTWGEKSGTIVLTPRNGSLSQQYFAGENVLIQLDDQGNRIAGKLADRYILRRTDITDNPPSHAH